ncbi:MAG: hypothetical protein ACOCQM_09375 [Natronomonas sp.]
MTEDSNAPMTRRGVMKGVGGLAAVSMSGVSIAEAQDVMGQEVPADPHTRDTYRAIVDAIVPRTPELEDELGPEHVPGGLDVELEKFLIWDFNHFQEVRLETLQTPVKTAQSGGSPFGDLGENNPLGDSLGGLTETDDVGSGTSLDSATELVDGLMAPELFQLDLDTVSSGSELGALADLAGLDSVGELGELLDVDDLDALGEELDFGAADRLAIDFADAPIPEDAEGIAEFDLLVEGANEGTHQVVQNYPYANMFPFVFDIVAAEFLAQGKNEDTPPPNPEFAGGGTFTRLSREDRLRCLWTIVDGAVIDRLDGVLSPMLPAVGILKFVVMACNGLHGFGYYTEWSGLGDTKTDMPSDREMQVDPSEVQSRTQTDYPGPADGYAADWRHAVPGGFDDEWETNETPGPADPELPDEAADEAEEATGGDLL